VALRLLADRTGLTSELSKAMARRSFVAVHDRGRVLTDVAVMLADGGEAIADIDVLRHQVGVLGPVASPPTVWRTLDAVTSGRLKRIAIARARVRRHVWTQIVERRGSIPASRVAGTDLGETVVLDVDATIVIAHSEKEQASPTFKKTFGFHPLGVWCDNTEEFLAGMLRTGKAGSNTAADHISVLADAIAQVPAVHRKKLLVRSDGAGASHDLLDWLTEQGRVRGRSVEYSVGFAITEKIRDAIGLVPKNVWTPATDPDGGIREGGDVAELTGLLDLKRWPAGMRVIVRRERPPPRCAAVVVRGTRRLALPGLRHQHEHRAVGVPRSPASCSCPGRGPDPARQRFWPGSVPVPGVQDQPDLADAHHDRCRLDRLDPAARLHRRREGARGV
jgi:hypothetical protein